MEYLLDTVSLVRYLSNSGKISQKAKVIFDKADKNQCSFFISTISLMEIMYLSEKKRIPITLNETVEKIQLSTIYEVIDLSTEIVLTAQTVEFYELHDRLILATAKYLGVPIISSDTKFNNVEGIQTIWE